ncbi:MAG: ImmA/IrrE family metallo-endopeptidase [Jatrophihabitantaceae bacterium]
MLSSLRELVPERRVRFSEALRIAELQATRLHTLLVVETEPVPSEVVTELPRIQIEYRDIPTSGLSYWNGSTWIVAINRWEPRTRQRFTLFHEFKHIIDHGRTKQLYASDRQAENAADYFAGCALMPRSALKRAWSDLIQRPTVLAGLFDVSPRAITVRLAQVGLTEQQNERCAGQGNSIQPRPGRYHRQRSISPYNFLEAQPT